MRCSVAALAAFGLLAVGCAGVGSPADGVPSATERTRGAMFVSWAHGYRSLGELDEAADLVVEGRVAEVKADGWVEPDRPIPRAPTIPQSLVGVDVLQRIKGRAPDRVVVTQTGGEAKGSVTEVEGDPLMRQGDHVLLYLRRAEGEDLYVVLGGPQGRFAVGDDGTLSTVGEPAVDLPEGTNLSEIASRGRAPILRRRAGLDASSPRLVAAHLCESLLRW